MARSDKSSVTGDIGRRLAHRALMPIVATAASALAGYAAKKGPELFEDKVLPKLKDAMNGAGGAAEGIPARAKTAAGSVGDKAEKVTSGVKDVTPGGNGGGAAHRGELSQEELKRHVKRRAEARAARRKANSRR